MTHMRAWLSQQQSTAPSPSDVRWVLKSPWATPLLHELVEVFPDAKVVITSRDPKKVVPSLAAMYAFWSHIRIDNARWGRKFLGDFALRQCAMWAQAQKDFAQAQSAKVLLFKYNDMIADPLATVRQVYAHADLQL